ncbi:glycosyl transferase, group 2 family [marine gamma proteobacterium HTCC2148]|nr:glycosyl transferase, group 2 family [marine gamma proteobacterium HTCC2148]
MTITALKDEGKTMLSSVAIMIPAFNEGEVISQVISEIREACDFPIFVIDDASTDDTILKAKKAGANIIPLPAQLGAWGAMQTGLRYALRHGYDVVITMDADGQHEASALQDLLRPVSQGVADVSIGACTERGSFMRKFAWILMKKFSGLTLEDITSGLRVYNSKAIRELAGWRATLLDYQDIGVLLLLQSKGIKIADVKVPMQPRLNGKSRVFNSWMMVIYYMCQTLILGLSKRQLARRYHRPRVVG